jgi:hypothetical protein
MDRTEGTIMTGTNAVPVLRARGLHREYGRQAGLVRAVDGVDLDDQTRLQGGTTGHLGTLAGLEG